MDLVHVSKLFVEQCKSIEEQEIPLEGLVLLFGANSSGKTNVLEAISEVLGSAFNSRYDPAGDSLQIMGLVHFDLPRADMRREPDAEIFRALICGEYEDGTNWPWLGGDDAELLHGETEEEAIQFHVH